MVWTSLLQILLQHRQDLYTNIAGGEEEEVSEGYDNPSSALTLTHAVDEACYHQDGVEVPLLLQVVLQNTSEGEW